MDQIRESLDRIAELSEEDLKSLEDSIVSEFGTFETQDPTREVVEAMTELADAADVIRGEQERRAEEASELASKASEASSRVLGNKNTEGEDEDDEEDEKDAKKEEKKEFSSDSKKDSDKEDDKEDEEDKKKKKKEFSSDDSEAPAEAVIEAPNESEASNEEAPVEAPSDEVAEEAELSSENTPSAEEAPAEAELSAEETTPENNVAEEFATEETESSEEPVTASNTPNGELDFEAPADRRPNAPKEAPVTITAGADLPGIVAGSPLPNLTAVAQGILDRKKGMGRTTGGDGEQALVASFSTSFPEDRSLNSDDNEGNRAKIDGVVSAEAIVAAGGLTAPVETSYEIYGLGETEDRPVKNSLAVFGADRGGIRFMTPPVLADLNGAVSTWTLEDDIAAAAEDGSGPVKPALRVQAGEEVTVYTDAIPMILTFGNLGARAYPELVERHIKLGMVEHARYAETRLLTRIGSLSTPVTASAELGAARDIFVQIEQAASAYRSRYRLSPEASLRVMFPEWFKNALRADLTKQLPGDGREGTFNLAEAEINKWFAVRNINVSWFLDGEEGQVFGEQNAGALLDFPSDVIWYLFSEGTFLFLDGGTLDLGLVRDSQLNGTNDYKLFLETFEGVAKVGVESIRVTSKLAIAGASAATVATTA